MPYNITSDDILYRRIPHQPSFWKEVNGVKVPSSGNFKTKKGEDGLSVNIAELIDPEAIVSKYPNNDVAEFSASVPISEGFNCIQKGKDHTHAIIEGDTNPIAKKITKAVTRVFTFS
ncbi:MAG: hypothetical protein U9R42_07955 [Bacteroidota bacterium]|nr:hypothetical protein [Bacteroidota bacterium]